MKLKRVLSVCLAAATVATCSSVVSAADNGFAVRTPINLATGEEVTDTLTAGDVLAIPVDVFSSTGGIDSLTFDVNFTDVLSIGYADTDLSDDQYANLESLGEIITEDDGTDVVVKNIYKAGRKKTYPGSWTINPNYVKDGVRCVRAVWANALTISTTDDPEAYIVCSVTKDVTADELNTALTGSSSEVISFSDIDGNMEDHALMFFPCNLRCAVKSNGSSHHQFVSRRKKPADFSLQCFHSRFSKPHFLFSLQKKREDSRNYHCQNKNHCNDGCHKLSFFRIKHSHISNLSFSSSRRIFSYISPKGQNQSVFGSALSELKPQLLE